MWSIICLFRLILQAKSFVLFYLWYSSCFNVKCWFHTFQVVFSYFYGSTNPSWSLRLSCQFFSKPACFSSSGSHHFFPSARSILSFLNGIHSICPKLPLFIPALPPFFFKDSDFLIKYPFIHVRFLHSFPVNVLIRWFPMKMLNSFKFIILHCCFFSGGSNSSFRYSSYSFPQF